MNYHFLGYTLVGRQTVRLKRWPEQLSKKEDQGSETEVLGFKKLKVEDKWRALCLVMK